MATLSDNQQWGLAPEDTEVQYYLDYAQTIQEQERYLTQQEANRRYSLGYSQFEGIPEDAELTFSAGGTALSEWQRTGERLAEKAVLSWRVEKLTGSQIGDLGASMKAGSEIELKDFVKQRGGHKPEGLHKAAAQGDRAGIMQYMKYHGPGAPINELDSNGCTPLMYAAMADSILAIEMLLNFSARREQTDSEGRTAVHYAAFFGKHRALKFLIEAAADWTPRDVYGRTSLHWSAANKSTKCLTVLLNHASIVLGDINPRDNEDMTPVHCAAQFGRAKHILLLNQVDADFAAVDIEGKTALHWTVNNPDSSTILALLEAYPPLLNKIDAHRNTVLHLAAAAGSTHIVDALLRLTGVEIDATNDEERTALHLACVHNHPESAELLISHRALDALLDADGLTALHYAIEARSLSVVQAFARLKDLANIPNIEGKTPLMVAAENGMSEIVKVLVKNQSVTKTVDSVEPTGKTALHFAAQTGSLDSIRSLLSSGANPNLQDNLQQSPLFLAVEQGHPGCVQALISGGCQPDSRDNEGQAPLHKALLYDQANCLQPLAVGGANLNILDPSGNTALHMAAYSGDDQAATTLLEYGANPNIQNMNGWSPVHYACMEGNIECLATLITHKTNTNLRDFSDECYTALDYAVINGHEDCVEILTQAGALFTDEIRTMAAISIQTAYRAHRARMELSELKRKSKAVTSISAIVRGFLQRRRFKEKKRRHYAAILIQAYVKGFLQKVKFKAQLSQHRSQKHHYQLMVDYGHRVAEDHANNVLRNFTREEIVSCTENLTALDIYNIEEQREREKKLRLEAALRMREIFLEMQKNWKEFREAEQRRRAEKARREELDQYADIVAQSRARREYTEQMFHQTQTVRSHTEAAIVIQRAYRRMTLWRSLSEKVALRQMREQRRREQKAARIIQKALRKYCQYKLFQELHFKKIRTSPVIALKDMKGRQLEDVTSYRRGITITGSPRRKVHQTEQSGFKLFRPTTRDLLFKPQSRTFSGTYSSPFPPPPTSAVDKTLSYLLSQQAKLSEKETPLTSQSKKSVLQKQAMRGRFLPKLFIEEPPGLGAKNEKSKLHLPNIVSGT